jgi:KaiC/GvpD/RAD55 family RecA-like ATPase
MLMTSGVLHGYLPVLGRGVVVSRGAASVHLNLFVIFVAESGTTRKSTSVRMASKFARSISGEDVAFIESRITPEKLEFDLAMQSAEYGYAYATIAIDELVKFLGQEKYVKGMPTLLTDLVR